MLCCPTIKTQKVYTLCMGTPKNIRYPAHHGLIDYKILKIIRPFQWFRHRL